MTALDKYVQRMSTDAESENYHEMAGIYREIADALTEYISPKLALIIMKKIGRLHG